MIRRAAAAILYLLATSCAQVGEPEYPSPQIPNPVTDLVAVQRGDQILVSFTIPPRTTDGLLVRHIRSVDVEAATKTADVPVPEGPGRVNAKIPIAGLIGTTVVVRERTQGRKGHYSAWSNGVTINVQPPVAAPADVVAKAGPNGVELSWQATGATSFRIFRRDAGAKTPAQVGESDTTSFVDHTSEYDKAYEYYVQALHDKAESEVSPPLNITPVDKFPPAVPAGVTAVGGTNAIELAWERNTEPDFAKYIIYRAAGDGPFEKLVETDAPVYSDKAVKSGTRYRYAISSVDQKGNESARSAAVEAVAP